MFNVGMMQFGDVFAITIFCKTADPADLSHTGQYLLNNSAYRIKNELTSSRLKEEDLYFMLFVQYDGPSGRTIRIPSQIFFHLN